MLAAFASALSSILAGISEGTSAAGAEDSSGSRSSSSPNISDRAEPTSLLEMFSSSLNSSSGLSAADSLLMESIAEFSEADRSSIAESSASSLPGIIEAKAANGSSPAGSATSAAEASASAACGSFSENSSAGAASVDSAAGSAVNSSLKSMLPTSGMLKSVSEISPAIAAAAAAPTTTSYSSFQKVFSGSISCKRR